jgi:hypothetical protein
VQPSSIRKSPDALPESASAETISGADPVFMRFTNCSAPTVPCGCVPAKVTEVGLTIADGTAYVSVSVGGALEGVGPLTLDAPAATKLEPPPPPDTLAPLPTLAMIADPAPPPP